MRGRKPIPTSNETTGQPTPTKGRPQLPAHLTGEAAAEWERLCDELDQMGLLTTADRAALAMLAIAYARWTKAEAKIAELGEVVAAPKTKTPMPNPWLAIANKAHEQTLKLSAEFGLTPSSRCRIKLPESDRSAGEFDLE